MYRTTRNGFAAVKTRNRNLEQKNILRKNKLAVATLACTLKTRESIEATAINSTATRFPLSAVNLQRSCVRLKVWERTVVMGFVVFSKPLLASILSDRLLWVSAQ